MRVVRLLVAVLLGTSLASGALLPEPDSFALSRPALILAFLLSGAALALDVLDERWSGVVADALVLLAAVAANLEVPTATAVVAVAFAAQALPRALATWRRRQAARSAERAAPAHPPGARS